MKKIRTAPAAQEIVSLIRERRTGEVPTCTVIGTLE